MGLALPIQAARRSLSSIWRNVTDNTTMYVIGFAIVLGFSLLTAAAKTSLERTNPARLVGRVQGEAREIQQNHPFPVLNTLYYSRAGLYWTQIFLHFALAGLGVAILFPWLTQAENIWWIVVLCIVAALAIAWLEWFVSERAAEKADELAPRMVAFARIPTVILYPLLTLAFQISPKTNGSENGLSLVTEDELKSLMDAGQQEGLLEKDERKMIYSIFRLGDTLAREIMIPRIDIKALDVQTPLIEAVDTLLQTGYSRVPVYEETVDNVLGVLYTKDLLRVWREGNEFSSLLSLLRPAYFVPEAKKVDELLAEMQARRVHLAVVVDEYGGVAGVVSLEDIVEEIVGEIQDEYDQAEESPYQELENGEYIFQGRVDLDDFNEIMGSYLPSDEADTIGGFIYNRIGRVPYNGERIQFNNLILTVEQVSGRRIRKVRANWVPVELEGKKEETNVDK